MADDRDQVPRANKGDEPLYPPRMEGPVADSRSRRNVQRARIASAGILLVAVILSAHASFVLSSPTDEFGRIVTGLTYLRHHDYRMDFATPPLAKYLVAAPLLFTDVDLALDDPTWHDIDDIAWMDVVAFDAGNDPLDILQRARAPMLLLLVALGSLVFAWARRLYGPSGAVLATAVFALSPSTLAYTWFVNMDFALALALTAVLFALWRFLNRPTRERLMVCGMAMGAAWTTHFASISLAVILPCLFIATAVHWWRSGSDPPGAASSDKRIVFKALSTRKPLFLLACLSSMVGVALLVVWVVYGFEVRPLLENAPDVAGKISWIEQHVPGPEAFSAWLAARASETPLPGATFARGILNVVRRTGELGTQGYWWFYSAVFAAKIPLPFLIILGWAVLRRPRRPSYDELFLLLPAAIFFFLASRSVYQSGLRNIYAILPLLAIYSGRILCPRFPQAMQVSSPGSRARILAAAICVWLGLIALKVHPHHISYYNALVGGPSGGIWASVGSTDLNWGQGWILLRRTMEREGIDEIYLGSPGRFRPSAYGVAARRIRFDAFNDPERLPPGVYAISTTYVRRFDWLKAKKPFARVGNVLWLYRLDGSAAGGRRPDA